MKTLLNFGHPLTAKTTAQIEAIEGPFTEIIIPCQLDFLRPIAPQVADLEAGQHDVRLQSADMVIPPALSSAAFLLAADHLVSGKRPKLVWLMRAGTPPQFVLGGIE